MKKRLLSIVLALVMVLCLAPTTVFAKSGGTKYCWQCLWWRETNYVYNNDSTHNLVCSKGHTVESNIAHTVGTAATCTASAVCADCESSYGSTNPNNHTGKQVWVKIDDAHDKQIWDCCGAVVVAEADHDWANADGKCTKCQATHSHSGGVANCEKGKICETCGYEYTGTDPTNHTKEADWDRTDETHVMKYECCGAEIAGTSGKHRGGTATCTEQATCKICGGKYGEKDADKHTGEEKWVSIDANSHKQIWSCCEAVIVESADHEWKDGKCTVCGYPCTHENIDYDDITAETHTEKCTDCGKVLVEDESHAWEDGHCTKCEYACEHPDTTCTEIDAYTHNKVCDICDIELVESEPHDWTNKDGVCVDCKYQCQHKDENEDHYCDICGMHTNHTLRHENAEPATATTYGNKEYWVCTGCGKFFSDENATNEIKQSDTVTDKLAITSGNGATVTAGEKKELTFTSTAEFEYFIRVELDGKTVDGSNYTVKEGSTIVTLKADYVATLAEGKHTLGIVSEGGTATAEFTVAKNSSSATDTTDKTDTTGTTGTTDTSATTKSPQTGDSSNIALWIALLCISGGAVTTTTLVSRKKKYNK